MAKCTDNEREFLDAYFQGTVSDDLEFKVMSDRISKEMKDDLIKAKLNYEKAFKALETAKGRFFAICNDKRMHAIVRSLEIEAVSPLK